MKEISNSNGTSPLSRPPLVSKQRLTYLISMSMLTALSYVLMLTVKIPVVLFLSYEPKDVVIVIAGFIYGPLSAAIISVVVSIIEMITVSNTGYIGLIMNIISTCTFAMTAAAIYKKKHDIRGAVIGLVVGALLATATMALWNIIITPIYTGKPREEIIQIIPTVFLPFNIIKSSINAALAILLYKPIVLGLRKAKIVPASDRAQGSKKFQLHPGVIVGALFVLLTCILLILALQGKI